MEIGKDPSQAYVEKAKANSEAERKKNKLQRLAPTMSSHPAHAKPIIFADVQESQEKKEREINYRIYGYQA